MTTISYKLIRKPGHPNACTNGQIKEHVYVMSELLGRPLDGLEVVHHIDEDPTNNTPGNLQLFANQAAHVTHHNILRAQQKAAGIVVAVFKTTEGALRYVFEFDTPKGVLHIYGPSQLEGAVERRGLE